MSVIREKASWEVEFEKKFSLPTQPSSVIPDIPLTLDDLTDSQLMETYAEFVSWQSYTKGVLVSAEIEEDRLSRVVNLMEVKALIDQWEKRTKGDQVTITKARRDASPLVQEAVEEYQAARAYRKLVEVMYDKCDKGATVLSRELSRRIGLRQKA